MKPEELSDWYHVNNLAVDIPPELFNNINTVLETGISPESLNSGTPAAYSAFKEALEAKYHHELTSPSSMFRIGPPREDVTRNGHTVDFDVKSPLEQGMVGVYHKVDPAYVRGSRILTMAHAERLMG